MSDVNLYHEAKPHALGVNTVLKSSIEMPNTSSGEEATHVKDEEFARNASPVLAAAC